MHDRDALGLRKIQSDSAFVAVAVDKKRSQTAALKVWQTHDLANSRGFHFDYISTLVAKNHGGEGTRYNGRYINDSNAFKGAKHSYNSLRV